MTDKNIFNKKVAWITGASSGIGEALALKLGKMGATLVISSNEIDELERVQTECSVNNDNVDILEIDLSDPTNLEVAAKKVLEKHGKVDFLFNNGGISQRSLAKDTDLTVDRKIMEIDYFGHVVLTKSLLPSMIEQKSGHIIVTSSILGKIGTPMRTAYAAAKHALHGFFDSLRAEVWRENINITLICPAAVSTNISQSALTGKGEKFGRTESIILEGSTTDECATQIINSVIKRKEEVVVGKGIGRVAVYIKRFLPSVYSSMVKKSNIM